MAVVLDSPAGDADPAPRWPHVSASLGLTFGLTWLLDLTIDLRGDGTRVADLG
jgi:hypothetical protein